MENKKRGNPNFSVRQREEGTSHDGILTLKAVYKTKHRIQPAFDPKSGWYAGVDRLSDEDKKGLKYFVVVDDPNGKNTTILLEDGYEVDLNNERDRINWEWMKHCKEIAMSFEESQKSPSAYFYVHQDGIEAVKKNATYTKKHKATSYVLEDSATNHKDRATLLGHDFTYEHPEVVKEFLLEMAATKPDAILDLYEGDTLALRLLVLKAIKAGEITFRDNLHVFASTPLGTTQESVVAFLQTPKGKEIADLLDQTINAHEFNKD